MVLFFPCPFLVKGSIPYATGGGKGGGAGSSEAGKYCMTTKFTLSLFYPLKALGHEIELKNF